MVMLGSPSPGMRDITLMSFCQLLMDRMFWAAEMPAYCPDRAPLNDPATEQRDIGFWKEWWQTHRAEIARTVTLPDVSEPVRYQVAQSGYGQPVEVPIEIRFMSLLNLAGTGRARTIRWRPSSPPTIAMFMNKSARPSTPGWPPFRSARKRRSTPRA